MAYYGPTNNIPGTPGAGYGQYQPYHQPHMPPQQGYGPTAPPPPPPQNPCSQPPSSHHYPMPCPFNNTAPFPSPGSHVARPFHTGQVNPYPNPAPPGMPPMASRAHFSGMSPQPITHHQAPVVPPYQQPPGHLPGPPANAQRPSVRPPPPPGMPPQYTAPMSSHPRQTQSSQQQPFTRPAPAGSHPRPQKRIFQPRPQAAPPFRHLTIPKAEMPHSDMHKRLGNVLEALKKLAPIVRSIDLTNFRMPALSSLLSNVQESVRTNNTSSYSTHLASQDLVYAQQEVAAVFPFLHALTLYTFTPDGMNAAGAAWSEITEFSENYNLAITAQALEIPLADDDPRVRPQWCRGQRAVTAWLQEACIGLEQYLYNLPETAPDPPDIRPLEKLYKARGSALEVVDQGIRSAARQTFESVQRYLAAHPIDRKNIEVSLAWRGIEVWDRLFSDSARPSLQVHEDFRPPVDSYEHLFGQVYNDYLDDMLMTLNKIASYYRTGFLEELNEKIIYATIDFRPYFTMRSLGVRNPDLNLAMIARTKLGEILEVREAIRPYLQLLDVRQCRGNLNDAQKMEHQIEVGFLRLVAEVEG